MHKQIFLENLERLKLVMSDAKSSPDLTQSAVAQYVCVSTNGYLEEYLQKSMIEKYRGRCDRHSLRMISKFVEKYYNFKSEKIQKFIHDLWPEKNEAVKNFLKTDDEFRDSLGSIVGNKNRVGHTGSSSATIRGVENWLNVIIDRLDELDCACFV